MPLQLAPATIGNIGVMTAWLPLIESIKQKLHTYHTSGMRKAKNLDELHHLSSCCLEVFIQRVM